MNLSRRNCTLISPVSTQVFPVVVTALAVKPAKVILLTTPKVNIFANLIEKALIFAGIEVEQKTINPYCSLSIKKSIKDIENPFFLLNCGTKFTAINLYRLSNGRNAYYYIPDGRIVDFNGRELLRVPENLVDVELHAQMLVSK